MEVEAVDVLRRHQLTVYRGGEFVFSALRRSGAQAHPGGKVGAHLRGRLTVQLPGAEQPAVGDDLFPIPGKVGLYRHRTRLIAVEFERCQEVHILQRSQLPFREKQPGCLAQRL